MPARALYSPGPASARRAAIHRISEKLPRLSLSTLQAIERIIVRQGPDAAANGPFNLSIQDLRLLQSFRGIPDDIRRKEVLDAMEAMCHAYD